MLDGPQSVFCSTKYLFLICSDLVVSSILRLNLASKTSIISRTTIVKESTTRALLISILGRADAKS